MYQQPVVDKKDLKYGSAKVEISDDGVSYASLGTGNKVKFSEKLTTQDITSENGGILDTIVKDQTCEVGFTLMEFNENILQQARGGIDTYSTVAGSAVPVTNEALGTGWTAGQPIKLANQNGANTIVASIVVKAGSTTLSLGTDYNTYVGNGANGVLGATYIVPISVQAGVLTANYSYTPNAARIIKSGGKTAIAAKYLRLTNKRASDSKKFEIIVYQARNADGISIDFPGDDEGKAWEMPLKFTGSKNANREAGDQLFQITNEQL